MLHIHEGFHGAMGTTPLVPYWNLLPPFREGIALTEWLVSARQHLPTLRRCRFVRRECRFLRTGVPTPTSLGGVVITITQFPKAAGAICRFVGTVVALVSFFQVFFIFFEVFVSPAPGHVGSPFQHGDVMGSSRGRIQRCSKGSASSGCSVA